MATNNEIANNGESALISPMLPISTYAISMGVVVAMTTIVLYYKHKFSYWRKLGINGPDPYLFVGTFLTELRGTSVLVTHKWVQQFGRVFGTYRGTKPFLIVADAEIIKNIMVKDAHIFPNHVLVEHMGENTNNMLFFMRDSRWKALRSLLAFTMTSGKIKRYFPLMKESSDELIAIVGEIAKRNSQSNGKIQDKGISRNEKEKNILDAKTVYGCYTIDVIARAAFAARLDSVESEQKHRSDLVSTLFENMGKIFWSRIIMAIAIPKAILRFFNFQLNDRKMDSKLEQLINRLIESRRKLGDKGRREDLLQTLLDLDATNTGIGQHLVERVEGDESESHHVVGADVDEIDQTLQEESQINVKINNYDVKDMMSVGKKLKLTDSEIIGNCILFLIAGYETTSSMLLYATLTLAYHPEAQEKLYEELRLNLSDGEFVYEKIMSLPYLDAVISETLRLFPPAPQMDRQAAQEYKIESLNITLPKDAAVVIPFYSIHRDPEYYEQPESFKPERFLPENRHKLTPYTYLPFGAGIRHCLGMRFALAEGKLALARLVYNFKFSPAPGYSYPPRIKRSLGILKSDDVSVSVEARN